MDAFERGKAGGIYHLGSGEERRNITLVQSLCEQLASKKPGADYLKLITYVEDRLGHDYRYALDIGSAQEIGFSAEVSFAEGMNATIDWYLANGAWVETMKQWKGM